MKTLRAILALPLLVLQLVAMAIGAGMQHLSRGAWKAAGFIQRRGYYPLCQARRWIEREPTWKPIDFEFFGIQPRTDEERLQLDRYVQDEINSRAADRIDFTKKCSDERAVTGDQRE